jgi:hypothetical protein
MQEQRKTRRRRRERGKKMNEEEERICRAGTVSRSRKTRLRRRINWTGFARASLPFHRKLHRRELSSIHSQLSSQQHD